ncbi:abscission/NoCut checkpoint regulator isoform X1 [Ooceraea biroi]|uniref:Zinc finger FYVE domain-containing protein n=2 Tax=Ooceraea biroi TaxID=2015173 RepID=A0A026WTD0_OOCBI|nr:abscission/NoCut checkpoint regulator isoform X1 [Ooceraea biroi]EZA59320.1 Zinc finger FYVE domain-containing protein [Ooceraea biroi]
MPCNTCQAKFSVFTKEIGCPACGFSHCKKCLKYKCEIPNVGTKKVCGPCYNKLSKMSNSSPEDATNDTLMSDANEKLKLFSMVDDVVMKLDSLENPAKPPIVMYKHTSHWDKLKKGLEPADQQIVDRLQKLKDDKRNHPLPTDDEIKQRLALLKDQDPEANRSKTINIHQVDTRTDQQKADDLIQQYYEQLQLASANDPYTEIQGRLMALHKDDDVYFNQNKGKEMQDMTINVTDDDSDDDVKSVNKLIASLKLQQMDDLSEELDVSSASDPSDQSRENSEEEPRSDDKTI